MTRVVHFAVYQTFTPAVGTPFETLKLACGAPEKPYVAPGGTNYSAVKEQVTCRRCLRSPLYCPISYWERRFEGR